MATCQRQKQRDLARIKEGIEKMCATALGHVPNKGDMENILGKAGLRFKDVRILLLLPQVLMCKRKN